MALSSIVVAIAAIGVFCALNSNNVFTIADRFYGIYTEHQPLHDAIEQLSSQVSATQQSYISLLDYQDPQWNITYANWKVLRGRTEAALSAFLSETEKAGVDGTMVDTIARSWLRQMRTSLDVRRAGSEAVIDAQVTVQVMSDYLLMQDAMRMAHAQQNTGYTQQLETWRQRTRERL
ncbi:MAG: hypothetical protein PHO66_02180, partial [Eubacteriales bacterium]|nr:hypothetical protein [Eubacteriales bacterium]